MLRSAGEKPYSKTIKVAFIDSDVSQSASMPPANIGSRLGSNENDMGTDYSSIMHFAAEIPSD